MRADGRRVSDEFARAVLDVVRVIPPGRVMSYGDVAAVLGSRAARAVGSVMAWYGGEVSWWRVVRADGRPAQGHESEALRRLGAEGTPLTAAGDRVAMRSARWRP